MYYDVQVKLTQGWFTVWYDLECVAHLESACAEMARLGHEVRYIMHRCTV